MANKKIDVQALLQDPNFALVYAMTPASVPEEAAAVDAYLRARLPAAPLAAPRAAFNVVGSRVPRGHDIPRVKGTAQFTHDITLDGMLHAAVLYSPHPHARIRSITTEKAEALPGVRAVITYKNVYDYAPRAPLSRRPDRYILQDEVFLAGDEVAAVAADDIQTARNAVRLIQVEYEPLPASFGNPEEAAKDNAPRVFAGGNLAADARTIRVGDVDAGLAQADLRLEQRYEVPTLQHGELEPRDAVAMWDADDQLTVWTASQYAHGIRSSLATVFGVPISKVRVLSTHMGGGFGNKTSGDRVHFLPAVLARATGRPVKIYYRRPEHFTTATHKAANVVYLNAGVKRDGILTALDVRTYSDDGGWGGWTSSAQNAQESQQTLYQYGAARFQLYDVETNRFRTGPMRDINESAGVWALETHMDVLAERLGMDPVEFRLKNVTGERSPLNNLPWTSNGVRESIQRGAEAFGWKAKWHKPGARITGGKAHGVGMGVFASAKGSQSGAMSGVVKVERDGSVSVLTGAQEIGGGQETAMMMIAAEELGARLQDCQAYGTDSAFTSETGVTAASRQTKSGGMGILLAARNAKEQLFKLAMAPRSGNQPPLVPAAKIEELDSAGSFIFLKAEPSKRASFKDVLGTIPNVVIGAATAVTPPGWAQRTFGASFTELEVDLDTAEVTVLDYLAAHDVGKVINQLGIEQQFDGGLLFGFGFILYEELRLDPVFGFPIGNEWENYSMPTSLEVPARTRAIWVEQADKIGPFGAKGIGEPACTAPVASIANAVYNAIGTRFYQLPLDRPRLLEAIQAKGLRPA